MIKVTVEGEGDGVAAVATFIAHALIHHSGVAVNVDYVGPRKTATKGGMGRLVDDDIIVEAKPI